tara:strand:+ start:3534 stop:3767 length:234 start_codon:yes stop_codon:yes gene_type:complete
MGRPSDNISSSEGPGTIHAVLLEDGGYDSGGAYWGLGTPLWCAVTPEGRAFFRAADPLTGVKEICPDVETWAIGDDL